jgi:hypothetical protein
MPFDDPAPTAKIAIDAIDSDRLQQTKTCVSIIKRSEVDLEKQVNTQVTQRYEK